MQPIINPFIFYLISVAENLKIVSIVTLTVAGGALFILILWAFFEGEFSDSLVRPTKIISIILVIFLLISVFLPSQEACYQMLVAYAVTPNNLEMVKDTGVSIGDYIIESAKDIILTIQEGD